MTARDCLFIYVALFLSLFLSSFRFTDVLLYHFARTYALVLALVRALFLHLLSAIFIQLCLHIDCVMLSSGNWFCFLFFSCFFHFVRSFVVSLFVILSDRLLLCTHFIVVETFASFVIINCNIFVPLIVIVINLWLSKLSPHQIRVFQIEWHSENDLWRERKREHKKRKREEEEKGRNQWTTHCLSKL